MSGHIGHKFAAAVNSHDRIVNGARTSGIIISRALYDSYIQQYEQSQRLSRALQAVMTDGEHQLVMDEARRLRYAIPDEGAFMRELATYRDFLNSFNPHDVDVVRGDRVRLPLRAARGLYFMAEYNRALAEHVLVAVLHTEYLRRFTDLRRAGFAYAGPTALQETVNVLAAHGRTAAEEKRSRGHRDWPRFEG